MGKNLYRVSLRHGGNTTEHAIVANTLDEVLDYFRQWAEQTERGKDVRERYIERITHISVEPNIVVVKGAK